MVLLDLMDPLGLIALMDLLGHTDPKAVTLMNPNELTTPMDPKVPMAPIIHVAALATHMC